MKISNSPFSISVAEKDVPYSPDGSFDWLRATEAHQEWAIGKQYDSELPTQLKSLGSDALSCGVALPSIFTAFIADAELHKHLRSVNGDYLNLAGSLLPFAGGWLVCFLSDQQACAHWYLFLNHDGSDHCVVSSYEYFDADEMDYDLEDLKETNFRFWTESFEPFFCRYWIENEVMFSECEETPLPNVDSQILAMYTNGE